MPTKVAINGFGRIGRLFLRSAMNDKDFTKNFQIVAINDLGDPKTLAHLLKYDSVHGIWNVEIRPDKDSITVDGNKIRIFSERDPEKLPWKDMEVEIVLESTGIFKDKEGAEKHLKAGAKKVVVSAPGKGLDATLVLGVNEKIYDKKKHNLICMASCTTNCLAPMVKVLDENFGIKRGFMTTIHAYTNDQNILDLTHKDLRRARAACVSIIPTSTGAAKAIGEVIPKLKGKLDGFAMRVPVPDGSVTDLTVELEKEVTKDEINKAMANAASAELKGIMEFTEDPIVSVDVIHNNHSCVFDSQSTMVIGEKSSFVKVVGWYDNEWGYSCRLVDLMKIL
jgi:glyceraldehyde 3-phosphate dehydrogenase